MEGCTVRQVLIVTIAIVGNLVVTLATSTMTTHGTLRNFKVTPYLWPTLSGFVLCGYSIN